MDNLEWTNVSRLCEEENKNFDDWVNTEPSFQLMLNLGKYICQKEGKNKVEEYANEDCKNIHYIKCVKVVTNFRVYVHPYLLPYIKAWLYPDFAYELGKCLHEDEKDEEYIEVDVKKSLENEKQSIELSNFEENQIFKKIIDALQTQEVYSKHILQLVTIIMNKNNNL